MRGLALLFSGLLALPTIPGAFAQDAAGRLNLVIVEGDGAINNIRQRTAREPIVQVEDENHKPVAGAVVIFTLPDQGASGVFPNGGHSLTVMTDAQGRAVAHGLRPNTVQGQYQIHVTASHNGHTANATINQTNALAAGGAGAARSGMSGKLIAVLAVAGAAVAAGAIAATRGGGSSNNSSSSLVTISAGTGAVGPPR